MMHHHPRFVPPQDLGDKGHVGIGKGPSVDLGTVRVVTGCNIAPGRPDAFLKPCGIFYNPTLFWRQNVGKRLR